MDQLRRAAGNLYRVNTRAKSPHSHEGSMILGEMSNIIRR